MPRPVSSVDYYDIAVVGGGPAGAMAAIRAAQLKKNVVLVERNASIGRKILITGKGRCNLTNTADMETFMQKFGKQGQFLRSAFYEFFNDDLINFFKEYGLSAKAERQGRVFPSDDKSMSVVRALEKALAETGVHVLTGSRVMGIKNEGGIFHLKFEGRTEIWTNRLILATGGASYKATGSTGDGFHFAKLLGHTFNPLRPGLVPLKTKEPWVTEMQGLTLKNVRITFECGGKKIHSEIGEMLFTHFGVSGPLVLDLSSQVVDLLGDKKEIALSIDLKPGLTKEQLDNRMLRDIGEHGSINIKTLLKDMLPLKMIPVFASALNLDPAKRINQLAKGEREGITALLKDFRMTVVGALPLEEAMVTCGGIPVKDINPRTMESRVIPGLYFAGEIIDATAPSGGYNLQQAFSTGYLAGESAANPELSRKGGTSA
ncbi:MAG: NAD(P)/FAD-dependent oxidoreductase [Candidatus Omnitrophica bacterium]|nr:NAD(P)/FAD-dependent oxidoreductase [Candidatus Omnitrophota bacterium]